MTDCQEPKSSGSRLVAHAALREEALRLRDKADLLDKLANETEGKLSEEAEAMLWSLLMNARR